MRRSERFEATHTTLHVGAAERLEMQLPLRYLSVSGSTLRGNGKVNFLLGVNQRTSVWRSIDSHGYIVRKYQEASSNLQEG